ncbi:MAG: NAD(P)H-dependent oxidoreductase [bacterium]|nr:NAD(P)H-dependent oxidoreductase [bacterium]
MNPLNIHIIVGSTREGRFSEKPAQYMYAELAKREGVKAELIDLRDWPLPFFDASVTPSYKKEPYPHEIVERWAASVAEADGYIIVTPEYNHGYPAVLKNALDWVFKEWAYKPVGFVSYGSAVGARSVEQLRQVAIELSLVPLRPAIHIPGDMYMAATKADNADVAMAFAPIQERVNAFFDELIKLADALKPLRS